MSSDQSAALAFDTSSYPRTYWVAPGWKWLLVMLGAVLVLGALIGMVHSALPAAGGSAAAVSLVAPCAAFALMGIYLVKAMFSYRLILDADSIEVIGPLRHRKLRRDEIRGRRQPRRGLSILVLVPKDDSAKALKISLLLKTDAVFAQWVSSLEDLNAASASIAAGRRAHNLAVKRSEELPPEAPIAATPFPNLTRHETSGDEAIFRYPRLFCYFWLAGGLVFLYPVLFYQVLSNRADAQPFAAFACGAVGCLVVSRAIYFFRYRVIVSNTTITFGAFQLETIRLADVLDMKFLGGFRRVWRLQVYLRTGRCLEFRAGLRDFASLINLIRDRTGVGAGIEGASVLRSTNREGGIILLVWLIIVGAIVILSVLGA